MVISRCWSGGKIEDSKASEANLNLDMSTARSRSSLHNFSLTSFKWGGQRHLRCVKVNDDRRAPNRGSSPTSSEPPEPIRKRRSHFEPESSPDFKRSGSVSGSDCGIEAVRKKIVLDLQTQVDKMKSEVLSEGSEEIEPLFVNTAAAEAEEVEARPWNLRTRRALCKDPNASGGSGGRIPRVDERKPSFSPARRIDFEGEEKRPRAKLRVPLSKQEIEDDFVAMTGIRPPRKPKKRPRHVQKQIDRFLPGLWLSEIRASMYKVNENADLAKS